MHWRYSTHLGHSSKPKPIRMVQIESEAWIIVSIKTNKKNVLSNLNNPSSDSINGIWDRCDCWCTNRSLFAGQYEKQGVDFWIESFEKLCTTKIKENSLKWTSNVQKPTGGWFSIGFQFAFAANLKPVNSMNSKGESPGIKDNNRLAGLLSSSKLLSLKVLTLAPLVKLHLS